MLTKFEEVYKFFLNSISNDYRIKNLFLTDELLAEDMLQIWLMKAIVKFYECEQNLEDFNEQGKTFNFVLGLQEKVIVSDLMVLVWLEWNINNITQMNLSLTDNDYKHYAEERNLSGKSEYADRFREKVYHEMSQYSLRHNPIKDWATGG